MSCSSFSNLGVSLPFVPKISTGFKCGCLSVLAISGGRSNGNNVKPIAASSETNLIQHLHFAFPSCSNMWKKLKGIPGLMTMKEHMLNDYTHILDALPKMLDEVPWEIQEEFHDYVLRFYLRGMSKDELEVSVKDQILVVKVERTPFPKRTKKLLGPLGEGWFADSYVSYSKRIELPDDSEIHKIKAEIDRGVLCVTIPKSSYSKQTLEVRIE